MSQRIVAAAPTTPENPVTKGTPGAKSGFGLSKRRFCSVTQPQISWPAARERSRARRWSSGALATSASLMSVVGPSRIRSTGRPVPRAARSAQLISCAGPVEGVEQADAVALPGLHDHLVRQPLGGHVDQDL